jgi:hypothetical protein
MVSAVVPLTADAAAFPHAVGHKFARLSQALPHASIPAAFCIPVDWFIDAAGAERLQQLAELFDDLRATVGHDLTGCEFRIATLLDDLALTPRMLASLAAALERVAGPYAVRSSSTVEDGDEHSHAGLYESFLHLAGTEEVAAGVVACWKSFYSLRAVLGRLRAGDTDPSPRMAVIVQQMVPARLAGVAFTERDRVLIEAVTGTGDRLVSGEATAIREQHPLGASAPSPYGDVVALAGVLAGQLGSDVDMEWAWDGKALQLLQARPVTAAVSRRDVRRPLFAWESLYFSDTLPRDITLGPCADIFHAMTAKRAQLYRLARRYGLHANDGWIITFNGAGLRDPAHQPAWWINLAGQVVVDLGTTARQNIVPADHLTAFLAQVTNAYHDPYARHTAIVRRFIHGDSGAVTRRLPDRRIAMEHSAAGLLGINRGLDVPAPLTLPPLEDTAAWERTQPPQHWTRAALRHVAEFTTVVARTYPDAYLEWAVAAGEPHFIDHSVPGRQVTPQRLPEDAVIMSAGTARGPLVTIEDSAELAELSVAPIVSIGANAPVPASRYITTLLREVAAPGVKPVIYARRPYAILSMLIDHAAGFVFDGGSTLCHLAILLREAGIPAVVTRTPLPEATVSVTIDDGAILTDTTATGALPERRR